MEPHVIIAERLHPYYYPRMLFLQKGKVADYRANGNGNGNGCGRDLKTALEGPMEPRVKKAERAHPYYYPRILFLQKGKVAGYRGNGNGNGCGRDLKTAIEGSMEPRVKKAERAHSYYYPRILFLQGRKMADYRANGNGNGCG